MNGCMHASSSPTSFVHRPGNGGLALAGTDREFFTRAGTQRVSGHLADGARSRTQGQRNTGSQEGGREPAPPPPGEPARLDPRCQALWGWLTAQQPQPPGATPRPGLRSALCWSGRARGPSGSQAGSGPPRSRPHVVLPTSPGPRAGDHQGRLFVGAQPCLSNDLFFFVKFKQPRFSFRDHPSVEY